MERERLWAIVGLFLTHRSCQIMMFWPGFSVNFWNFYQLSSSASTHTSSADAKSPNWAGHSVCSSWQRRWLPWRTSSIFSSGRKSPRWRSLYFWKYPGDASGAVHQQVPLLDACLNQRIKSVEKYGDVFVLAVEQWVHDVVDAGADDDVVHVLCGSDDYIGHQLPVRIFYRKWKSPSNADWASPMYMLLELTASV